MSRTLRQVIVITWNSGAWRINRCDYITDTGVSPIANSQDSHSPIGASEVASWLEVQLADGETIHNAVRDPLSQ